MTTETITWNKLPKRDKEHLKENGIRTKAEFCQQVAFLKKCIMDFPNTNPCRECEMIVRKLGIWDGDF